MSTNGKVKVYKNPDRNKPANLKPYVPQYQQLGVEPAEYNSPLGPGNRVSLAKPVPLERNDNPRIKRPMISQPYAEAVPSPVGRGKGPLPNVGNNMEQTWSSVDGEIIDDISEADSDSNQAMIDNNDFVSAAALGLPEDTLLEVEDVSEEKPAKPFLTEDDLQDAIKKDSDFSELENLSEGEYVLMVTGTVVGYGSLEEIQEEARALVFGEHPSWDEPVSIDDIVVLKRVPIKIGLFLG